MKEFEEFEEEEEEVLFESDEEEAVEELTEEEEEDTKGGLTEYVTYTLYESTSSSYKRINLSSYVTSITSAYSSSAGVKKVSKSGKYVTVYRKSGPLCMGKKTITINGKTKKGSTTITLYLTFK